MAWTFERSRDPESSERLTGLRGDEPLRPIEIEEVIGLDECVLREPWPHQSATDVARGTLPFPEVRE